MIEKLIKLIKAPTIKNIFIILSSKILASFFSFIYIYILIRKISVSEFGNYNLTVEMIALVTSLTDVGLTTGFVRFYSFYIINDQIKAKYLLKYILKIKFTSSLIFIFFINIFSLKISIFLFSNENYQNLIKISSILILFHTMEGFLLSILQSKEKFLKFSVIVLGVALLKIVTLLSLEKLGEINILNLLLNLLLISFCSCLSLSYFLKDELKIKYFISNEKKQEVKKQLINFSKWVLLSSISVSIFMRLDVIMLKKLSTEIELGFYSGAQKMATILPIITASLTTVLMPKVSKIKEKSEFKGYIKKSFILSAVICIPLIIIYLSANTFIPIFLGQKYENSIKIFKFLLLSYIFGIFVNPISLILYNLNKTKELSIMNLIQVFINYIGNRLFIPKYGALGAVASTFLVGLFGSVYILTVYFYEKNKIEKQ